MADDDLDSLLADARQRALAGHPRQVKIRRLVNLAGAERRGARVIDKIQAALDRHGLATDPSFAKDWIDNRVLIRVVSSDGGTTSKASASSASDTDDDASLTVGSLESANREVARIDRNESLDRARAIMLRHDFSQLAVVSGGPRGLVGAVSWESMARAALRKPDYTLRDATVPAATARPGDDLIALVPTIIERGFLFVVGADRSLAGIVTTADLSEQFASLAGPFFLIGEIERRLRHVIGGNFSIEDCQQVRDPADSSREITGPSDLTIGEIQRLLEDPARWAQIGWPVDRKIFIEMLNEVREIRNDVMHFSTDPLTPEQLSTLQNFNGWLRVHDPRQ